MNVRDLSSVAPRYLTMGATLDRSSSGEPSPSIKFQLSAIFSFEKNTLSHNITDHNLVLNFEALA